MSFAVAAPPGNAPPRVELAPVSVRSQADDAGFLASAYGLTPDGWQARVLDVWLGESRSGRWSASRCGLAVPRQNGKNAILEVRELFGMVELGEKFLHTAHEVKTARKAFLRLAGFFENRAEWPELASLVRSIRKTNGQEAIVLSNGGSVEFVARSKGSGRGFTVDTLVMDEAQDLSDEQLEALLPTISSAPSGNPQTIMTGTPPKPGVSGEVFVRMRDAALEGSDPSLAWHEWSAELPEDGLDLSDESLWYATNPALGVRLHPEVVRSELAQMSEDGFTRERLGVWGFGGSSNVIDLQVWAKLKDEGSKPLDPVSFAVDVTPDRSHASVAIAAARQGDVTHVEVVDNGRGTGWVVGRVLELVGKWGGQVILDASGPAGSLIPRLSEAGVEPFVVSTREMGQACGLFYDTVVEGRLRHLGDPRLASALSAARKRPLGDAWAWHRKDPTVDISPLVAVTLALFGHETGSKKTKRTGAVW